MKEGTIDSPRLSLTLLSEAFMEAVIENDLEKAASLADLREPISPELSKNLMELRLGQLREDPELRPWLLRAMVIGESRVLAGHIGFHSKPDAPYLRELGLAGVEVGYTVFSPYRRRGYAGEAVRALFDWAHREHGIDRFVASISPENAPSIALARRLKFRRVSSHIDPVDGPENIFELRYES